LGKCLPL